MEGGGGWRQSCAFPPSTRCLTWPNASVSAQGETAEAASHASLVAVLVPEDEISGRQVRRVSCASGTARTPRRWPPRDMEDAPKLTERHGVLRCYCSCWAHRGASSRRRGKRPLEAATPGRPSKDTAWEAFRQGCWSNSSGGRRWRFAKAIWRVAVAFRQGCLLFRLVRRAWATKAHAAARIPLASGGQEKPGCRFPDLSAEPLGSRPSCCSDSSGVRG